MIYTMNFCSVGKILVLSHKMTLRGYGLAAFFFGSRSMPQTSWVMDSCLYFRGKAAMQEGTFQTRIMEWLFVIVVHSALAAHMKSLQNQKIIFINKIKPELNFRIIRQELHSVVEES